MPIQQEFEPDQPKDWIEQYMKVTEEVQFRSELHSLLVNRLNHIEVTSIKRLRFLISKFYDGILIYETKIYSKCFLCLLGYFVSVS